MRLRDIVGAARSRARIVIVTAIVALLVAVGISLVSPRVYLGRATVILTQQNTGASLLGAPDQYLSDMALQRDVATQINVMRSSVVLDPVIRDLGLDTGSTTLAKSVNVKFDGDTNIVTIDVKADSPEKAAAIANGIAKSYVAWSQEQQRRSIRTAIADVQTRLADAQKKIADTQSAIANGDTSAARRAELQAADSLYATLSDKLETLKINEQLSTGSGSILASASPDPDPVAPKPVRNGALGLVLGLVVGLGIAITVEMLDNTVKTAEDAKREFDAPVLASLPDDGKGKPGGPVALVADPGGPSAEAYRMLRNNLGFVNFEHDIKTVLVTSALPNEGKSTVAANLASVLARAGKRVVLVCTDFHRPGASDLLGVHNTVGLSDVLRETVAPQNALVELADSPGVAVMPPGAMPPNPSELLGSGAMRRLLANLREVADWVVLDSAPLLVVADTAAVAPFADGVLFVAKVDASTRDALHKSREQLDIVGARVLGLALCNVEDDAVRKGYSSYGSSSGSA